MTSWVLLRRDDNSRTALHWAAASDHAQICHLLVSSADKQAAAIAAAAAAAANSNGPSATSPDSEDPHGHSSVSVQERSFPSLPGPSGSLQMSHTHSSLDADSPTPATLAAGGAHGGMGMGMGGISGAGAANPNVPKPLITLTDDRGNTAVHIAARDACSTALNELVSAAAAAEQTHMHVLAQHAQNGDVATGPASTSKADTPQRHPVLLHRNKAGQTPLHCAVLGGSAACVSTLVAAAPTSTEATDRLGATPQETAIQRGCSAELLAALGVANDPNSVHAAEGGGVAKVATAGGGGFKRVQAPMLLVTSPDCLAHHTTKPPLLRGVSVPPENVRRLEVRFFSSSMFLGPRAWFFGLSLHRSIL